MKKKIKIMAFTGTRADYPRVKKVLEKIKLNKKFELKIVVSGTHVLKEYGNTYKEIILVKYGSCHLTDFMTLI